MKYKDCMFEDVGVFHHKFGLPHASCSDDAHCLLTTGIEPRMPDPALMEFRLKFGREEQRELEEAVAAGDIASAADALVDIVYIALGTAQIMGLPWQELWDEVQRANMAKERCGIDHKFQGPPAGSEHESADVCAHGEPVCGLPAAKHSKRGSAHDVIKPKGWKAPDIAAVLARAAKKAASSGPRADDPRFQPLDGGAAPTHYVNVGHGPRHRNGVFVKEAQFFADQGGLVQDWGRSWRPVTVPGDRASVETIERARDIGWGWVTKEGNNA